MNGATKNFFFLIKGVEGIRWQIMESSYEK